MDIDYSKILKAALAQGGEYADLYIEDTRPTAISLEDGKVERVISGVESGAGLRVIIGFRTIYAYTKEEMKMVNETHKMLDPNIKVTATTVRVPVFRCHSESVNIETEKKLTANEARSILAAASGVVVYDDPSKNVYPLAIDVAGKDDTYVGRIREDESVENGLNLWVVADNLRKGAALNAVQIAEELIK